MTPLVYFIIFIILISIHGCKHFSSKGLIIKFLKNRRLFTWKLCPMLCGSLDGRGVHRGIDTCACMAKSLHYSPETITTLLTGSTLIQNRKVLKNRRLLCWQMDFPGGSDQVWSLDWEDPLEKGMITHSIILAWEIPLSEKPRGLQPMGSQRLNNTFTFMLTDRMITPAASYIFRVPYFQ